MKKKRRADRAAVKKLDSIHQRMAGISEDEALATLLSGDDQDEVVPEERHQPLAASPPAAPDAADISESRARSHAWLTIDG